MGDDGSHDQVPGEAADRLLRLAMAAARVGSWEWNLRDNHVQWSEGVAEIFGLAPHEFDGTFQGYASRIEPGDRDKVLRAIDISLRGETRQYQVEHRVVWPDGSLHWVEARGDVIRDATGEPLRMIGTATDITRRKEAADGLIASEALMRQLIEYAPAAIAMFDREMRYLHVSARWIADYRLENTPLIGRTHYDVFPDVPQRWRDVHRRALAGAIEHCDEDPFPRADGSLDWLQWEVRPFRDARGEIGGIIMFTQVITERKRAETERARLTHDLHERVKELTLLHQAAHLLQHERPFDSPLLAELAALLPHAWQFPETCAARIAYADLEACTANFEPTQWGQTAHFSTSDGRQGTVEVVYREPRPIADEGPFLTEERSLIQSIADMLTAYLERKRAEAAIIASEARLRRVIAAPILGIAFVGPSGVVTEANDECLRLLEHTRDDLRRGQIDFTRLMQGEALAPASAGKRPREVELLRQNGTYLPALLGVSSIDDHLAHDVVFVVDLSERRALERQIQHAQRMEAVGRLAAGIAHDFNNILAAITMTSDLLREELAPEHPGVADAIEIRKSADRAVRLVRQLLAFSRQQVMEPRILELNDLVGQLETMLRRLIGEDVALVTRFGRDLGAVRADPSQLEQVIINLVVNARDAMPSGGTLTIETAAGTFESTPLADHATLPQGTYVILSVTDTGIGMDAQTKARIFEPFFTTKTQGKGTGLGLSTVYGIVRQSGGAVDLTSEIGGGTSFRVFLPRVESTAQTTPSWVPDAIGGSETILLVEDDSALRAISRKVLVKLGYHVLDAATPRMAMQMVRNHLGPIDLLLTDVVMPGGSGRALASEALALRRRMHVLFMSGYTDEVAFAHTAAGPGIAYLQKPFSSAVLAHRLRSLLDAE